MSCQERESLTLNSRLGANFHLFTAGGTSKAKISSEMDDLFGEVVDIRYWDDHRVSIVCM